MKRTALAGDDDVADAQPRVLRNVLDDDAREVAAGDSPPPPALHHCRNAAGVIGRQNDGAGERRDGGNASDGAVGAQDAVVAMHAGARAFVDGNGSRFVLGREADDARFDAVVETDDGPHAGFGSVCGGEFVQARVLFDQAAILGAQPPVLTLQLRQRDDRREQGARAAGSGGNDALARGKTACSQRPKPGLPIRSVARRFAAARVTRPR